MFEASLSLWETMASWFTPTVLFLLLNLVIGTIAITSALGGGSNNHYKNNPTHDTSFSTQLSRSASILHRLKSINFNPYRSQEPYFEKPHYQDINTHFAHQQTSSYSIQEEKPLFKTPSILQRLTSINFYPYRSQEPYPEKSHYQDVNTHFPHQQTSSYSVQEEKPLSKFPSILQRLTSINFYPYRSQEHAEKPHHRDINSTHFSQQRVSSHAIQEEEEKPLFKSPSILQRLKSINFYSYIAPQPPKQETHYSFQNTHHEEEEESADNDHGAGEMTLDEVYSKLKSGEFNRSKSDTKPAAGELPTKLPTKMKKSASVKSAFSHFKEDDIVETRRPATVKEGKDSVTDVDADDEEVDAKADDFINRFKQQLKLQRIESIIRYKEMIGRGGGE